MQFGALLACDEAQTSAERIIRNVLYICCQPADFWRTTLDEPAHPRTLSYVPIEMANVDNVSDEGCDRCSCIAGLSLGCLVCFSCVVTCSFTLQQCALSSISLSYVAMHKPHDFSTLIRLGIWSLSTPAGLHAWACL
jgi:hypothetical protein